MDATGAVKSIGNCQTLIITAAKSGLQDWPIVYLKSKALTSICHQLEGRGTTQNIDVLKTVAGFHLPCQYPSRVAHPAQHRCKKKRSELQNLFILRCAFQPFFPFPPPMANAVKVRSWKWRKPAGKRQPDYNRMTNYCNGCLDNPAVLQFLFQPRTRGCLSNDS